MSPISPRIIPPLIYPMPGIHLIGLCLPDVVLTHRGSLDRVDNADLVAFRYEEFN